MNTFSSKFRTYRSWRYGRKITSYAKRIIDLHKKSPSKTLTQLVGKKIISDISKRAWSSLTPNQKNLRKLSLKVLSEMRSGKSLMKSIDSFELNKQSVVKHIRSAVTKKGSKWFSKKFDRIQRAMVISSGGVQKTIIVTNSKDASLIGQYHSAVKQFLQTGDESLLKPFKNKIIVDNKGKKHKLETDPNTLFDIEDAKEDGEFFEIYGDSNA